MVVSLINKRVYFLHIFGGFDKNGQGPLKIASTVYRYFTLVVCCMVVFIKRCNDYLFPCESHSKKLQLKISFINTLLIKSMALTLLPFL